MKVLHYYPSNVQSNSLETYLKLLKANGMDVLVLTSCPKGDFHKNLEKEGIPYHTIEYSSKNRLVYYWKHIRFLSRFIKEHRVEHVFSHLQHSNFIAAIAYYLHKRPTTLFRHHLTLPGVETVSRMERLFDWVIDRFGKQLVVASASVLQNIQKYERIHPEKYRVIPYCYDFSHYPKPDPERVQAIRSGYAHRDFILLLCSRFVASKRHKYALEVLSLLVNKHGQNAQLLLLDQGPLVEEVKQQIKEMRLENHVEIIGFTKEFVNYMDASDLLFHPSLSETSSSTVKEMGLLGKPVIVTSSVGDFDDYILPGENGWKMKLEQSAEETADQLHAILQNREEMERSGKALNQTVQSTFGLSSFHLQDYLDLLK